MPSLGFPTVMLCCAVVCASTLADSAELLARARELTATCLAGSAEADGLGAAVASCGATAAALVRQLFSSLVPRQHGSTFAVSGLAMLLHRGAFAGMAAGRGARGGTNLLLRYGWLDTGLALLAALLMPRADRCGRMLMQLACVSTTFTFNVGLLSVAGHLRISDEIDNLQLEPPFTPRRAACAICSAVASFALHGLLPVGMTWLGRDFDAYWRLASTSLLAGCMRYFTSLLLDDDPEGASRSPFAPPGRAWDLSLAVAEPCLSRA